MSVKEYAFGVNLAASLVEHSPRRVVRVYIDQAKVNTRIKKLIEAVRQQRIIIDQCSRDEFERVLKQAKISENSVHQGVIVEFTPADSRDERWLSDYVSHKEAPFLLALDGITDPHNLGACIRSANAAGVDAVLIPKDKSVGLTPAVRKVASGAAEMTPLVTVKNLARCIESLQKHDIWVMGAAGEAEQSLYDLDLKGGVLIVMGAEGAGLRRLTREHCDHLFKIPMPGDVESLNVSVAAGVCLFEAVRQRRA